MSQTILVTGGAGFIGSAVVRLLIGETEFHVVNVDKLTYAGSLDSVAAVENDPRYRFEQVDICDPVEIGRIFRTYVPNGVIHLAAESHVDRSIDGPLPFIETNIIGTYTLLEQARAYVAEDASRAETFRFVHVSTDEVYGELGPTGKFTEDTPYQPSSPYSASKASSDHLARAWHRTFDLPVMVTNCSNNFGPFQYPEKLIPVVILNALRGEPIPIYGRGDNIRDWLFVEDHARALVTVLEKGRPGETYNVGASNERTNLEVVRAICALMDELVVESAVPDHGSLISFVGDRPGHDWRYAIDATRIQADLGWKPQVSFEDGLRQTVAWYVEHLDWCASMLAESAGIPRRGLGVTG